MLNNETGFLKEPQAAESRIETVINKPETAFDLTSLRIRVPATVEAATGKKSKFNLLDPGSVRIDWSPESEASIQKVVTTVFIRNPKKQEWIRVPGDESYRLSPLAILEFELDERTHLVLPRLAEALSHEARIHQPYQAWKRSDRGEGLFEKLKVITFCTN